MPILKRLNSKTVIVAPSDSELPSGHVIEDEAQEFTQRSNLQFVGNGVEVTDDSGSGRTVVTISGEAESQITNDADGNVCIDLNPIASTLVLQSPDTTKWDVTVDVSGNLVATDGSVGDPDNIKLQRTDLTELQVEITNLGEIQLNTTLDPGAELKTSLFLEDSNNVFWKLGANNLNEITTSSTESLTNAFKVRDGAGNTIFHVQEEETGGGQIYFPVYDAGSLPASPTSVAGMSPIAMYDDTSDIRPIYYDGAWKYMSDNSNV